MDAAHMEKLAHHKRSNVTYSNFSKSLGRNNKMYHLSDGYNLEKREDDTYMDTIMAMKLAQKQHQFKQLQSKVTKDAIDRVLYDQHAK